MVLRVRGPRDLLDLRAYLWTNWQPGAIFDNAERVNLQMQVDRGEKGYAHRMAQRMDGARAEYHWQLQQLAGASLWWVTEPMCDMIAAAEQSIPDETLLENALIPTPRGLVVFERSFLGGVDAISGETVVRVDAVLWGPVRVRDLVTREWERAVGFASYTRLDMDEGMKGDEIELAVQTGAINTANLGEPIKHKVENEPGQSFLLHGEVWCPLGRGDWKRNTPITDRHEAIESEAAWTSMVEDRRRMAALWIISQQKKLCEIQEEHPDRAARRRAARAGYQDASPIRIVALPVRQMVPTTEPTDADRERRHVGVRFPVEGFWRSQPYGPRRAYRRPQYVASHWRGPEGAPVRMKEKIRVVRPPDPNDDDPKETRA